MAIHRIGVIVLGMHRSGTSLATALVAQLGFETTGRVTPPSPGNPKGYWEHSGVVDAHEEFLRAIGRSWSDARPLPPEVFTGEAAEKATAHLRELMEEDFRGHDLWVLKDPRMCRLLPLWRTILGSIPTRYLHVVRSPTAVMRSLAARDGFGVERSLLLWLRHYLEAERCTRGADRRWMQLERFEDDPHHEAKKLAQWLNVKDSELVAPAIESAYDRTLIHHRPGAKTLSNLVDGQPWIEKTFSALQDFSGNAGDAAAAVESLDQVRTEIAGADRLLFGDPVVFLGDQQRDHQVLMHNELLSLHRSVSVQRDEISAQRVEIDALRNFVAGSDDLAAVRDMVDSGGMQLRGMREELEDRLRRVERTASQRQHEIVEQLEEHHRRAVEDSSDQLAAVEARFRDKHVALLDRSLEVTRGIEEEMVKDRRELEALRGELAALSRAKSDLEAELAHARERCAGVGADVLDGRSQDAASGTALGEEKQRLRDQLDYMTGSVSWRLTTPLRWVRSRLKPGSKNDERQADE